MKTPSSPLLDLRCDLGVAIGDLILVSALPSARARNQRTFTPSARALPRIPILFRDDTPWAILIVNKRQTTVIFTSTR